MAGMAQNTSSMTFEDLKLRVGEGFRLETQASQARYRVNYIGHSLEQSILVSVPLVKGQPQFLPEGTAVTLRFMALNRACAFTSRVLKVTKAPFPHLFLAFPKRIEAVVVRTATRVSLKLIVSVDEAREGHFGGGWPRQAICSDISATGARIDATDLLGHVNDQIYMTARVKVGAVDQVMMVLCAIRNIEEHEDSQTGEYRVVHGVEFVELDEETCLIVTGFVYQQMLREHISL
jgi:c-di-GMP-binding flagellar brake protein YcgR